MPIAEVQIGSVGFYASDCGLLLASSCCIALHYPEGCATPTSKDLADVALGTRLSTSALSTSLSLLLDLEPVPDVEDAGARGGFWQAIEEILTGAKIWEQLDCHATARIPPARDGCPRGTRLVEVRLRHRAIHDQRQTQVHRLVPANNISCLLTAEDLQYSVQHVTIQLKWCKSNRSHQTAIQSTNARQPPSPLSLSAPVALWPHRRDPILHRAAFLDGKVSFTPNAEIEPNRYLKRKASDQEEGSVPLPVQSGFDRPLISDRPVPTAENLTRPQDESQEPGFGTSCPPQSNPADQYIDLIDATLRTYIGGTRIRLPDHISRSYGDVDVDVRLASIVPLYFRPRYRRLFEERVAPIPRIVGSLTAIVGCCQAPSLRAAFDRLTESVSDHDRAAGSATESRRAKATASTHNSNHKAIRRSLIQQAHKAVYNSTRSFSLESLRTQREPDSDEPETAPEILFDEVFANMASEDSWESLLSDEDEVFPDTRILEARAGDESSDPSSWQSLLDSDDSLDNSWSSLFPDSEDPGHDSMMSLFSDDEDYDADNTSLDREEGGELLDDVRVHIADYRPEQAGIGGLNYGDQFEDLMEVF